MVNISNKGINIILLSIGTLSSVRMHELNIRAEWRIFVSSNFGVLTIVYELLAVMSATLNLALECDVFDNSGIGLHTVISKLKHNAFAFYCLPLIRVFP